MSTRPGERAGQPEAGQPGVGQPERAWLAELAWSPGLGLRTDVLIEAAGRPVYRGYPGRCRRHQPPPGGWPG